jgi:hypothetical protein
MDLAVRATLKGWKFIYVGDIRVSRSCHEIILIKIISLM